MIKAVFIIFNLLGILAYQFNPDQLTVSQSLPDKISAGQSFVVQLQINKGDQKGFAKWQQEFPEGFQAEMLETRGGTFSFKDNILKLIWLELPNEESFTISYKVQTQVGLSAKAYDFNGRFSYVSDNMRKDIEPSVETVYISQTSIGEDPSKVRKIENANVRTERIIDFDAQKSEKKSNPNSSAKYGNSDSNWIGKHPANIAKQISYKVQIAAGHNAMQKHYKNYFQIDEPIAIESHNGWKKYTVGDFSDYGSAREKRNSLWVSNKNIEGAFVTAYLSGKRISVDEALKISEQQWIK